MSYAETSLCQSFLAVEAASSNHLDIPKSFLDQIYRSRKRIFIDRKKWEMESYKGEDIEFDEYDDNDAYYIYTLNGINVTGCVRLRPSTLPTLMTGPFKSLKDPVNNDLTIDESTWEASRLFITKNNVSGEKSAGIDKRTIAIFLGMINFGLAIGVTNFEVVVDATMRRVLKICGWPVNVLNSGFGSSNEKLYYGLLPCTLKSLNDIILIMSKSAALQADSVPNDQAVKSNSFESL